MSIVIFGSAGSGKTTLGKLVAKKLDFPYFDIDDYIWRKDTDIPFTVMYAYEEKVNRLMTDILKGTNFVMAEQILIKNYLYFVQEVTK